MSRFNNIEIDDRPVPTNEDPAPQAPRIDPTPPRALFTPVLPAPLMKTPHGVDMTPRAARVYTFLNANGVSITPFSTDATVAAARTRIEALRNRLAQSGIGADRGLDLPLHPTTVDVITDINAILTRVPQNRVNDGTQLPTEEGQGERRYGVRAAQGLVALSVEGQTTGAVMYWHLSGSCDLAKLTAAWKEQGLDETLLPGTPSPTVALSRAVKERATKHRLVRQHPQGGWVLVDEKAVKDEKGKETWNYALGLRVRLEEQPDKSVRLLATKPSNATPEQMEEVARLLREIRADYDRALTEIASVDISTWMVRLASFHLHAVALRETGGLYFVPKTKIEMFKKVKAAIKAATSHVVYEIPAMHSDEAIAAVLDAIVNETETLLVEIENEVAAKDFGVRGIKSRLNALDEAKEKVIGYAALLGRDLKKLIERIAVLRSKVAAVTTRGSMLETD